MDKPSKPEIPPAVYANFLRVAPQRSELFLLFGQVAGPQASGAHIVGSIVTSPAHAKAMLHALGDAVQRYEERYGPIRAESAEAAESRAAAPPQPAAITR